jgi:thiol-disulfide isomerase/thioredoxin
LSYLTAAVALVGVVAVAALLLVIALARRIRELGPLSAGGLRPGQRPVAYRLPPGSKPSYFSAVTTSGRTVSPVELSGHQALVGFFDTGCAPCRDQIPEFIEMAKTIPGGPDQVLAVVTGRPDTAAEFAGRLESVASVVLENPASGGIGPLAHSFSAFGWPSYYLLDSSGTVESSAPSISMLLAPITAGKPR